MYLVGCKRNHMNITDLPFPKYKNLKTKEYILPEDLYLEQWIIPKGTTVKLTTSQDFSFCILPVGCKDITGYVMHRRIFRY